jgi:4-hydroxy-tetrahydrodipicolinate synthase
MDRKIITLRGILSGIFAALPTPFRPNGVPDGHRIDPLVDFLIDAGLHGLCVGGATGEYSAYGINDRARLFRRVAKRARGRVQLIFGVGAGTANQVVKLSGIAADCGGSAVLLPPPHYFRYEAEEVVDFLRQTSSKLALPTLLYHIPQFTNQVDVKDLLNLIETIPNIVGIKDSSGARENLPLLAEAKARLSMTYLVGDDAFLFEAHGYGADGAISGIASACPELLVAIQQALRAGQTEKARTLQKLVDEFVVQAANLPAPWGVKLAVEARGFKMGPLSWPVGSLLKSRTESFRKWFATWIGQCLKVCLVDVSESSRG